MDPEFNTNLFSKRYTPIGIEDGVQFSIYELTIEPGFEELSYEISENGKTFDFGFGSRESAAKHFRLAIWFCFCCEPKPSCAFGFSVII